MLGLSNCITSNILTLQDMAWCCSELFEEEVYHGVNTVCLTPIVDCVPSHTSPPLSVNLGSFTD